MTDEQTTETTSPSEGLTGQDFARVHDMCRKQYRDTVKMIAGRPVGLSQVLNPMVMDLGTKTAAEAGVEPLRPDPAILPGSSDGDET